ncbi:sucrose phosphorylase [Alteromonas sp. ASW11-36]|uniref:Sucrose phosphorylase n=1 Tax=Alteromonas arenosi TaxID=3055817 RepID=A0ABT7ST65_9ALTE|nr:sucrose phosphorylase [Alteromonas sp. ASW11-36]MDM7859389.1 sucrose phosphorylase [Alteromonas sp. ASW11-36]
MPIKNGVQLITYADRLGNGALSDLQSLLEHELAGVFTGIHLLPFFYPFDGEDAGFDPIDHTIVDQRLGNWDSIKMLGESFDIMADLIVNHMSAQSVAFKDVLEHGQDSQFWPLFLTKQSVFSDDDDAGIAKVFRPRPTPFFTEYTVANNGTVPFWTTFTANQIDIDVESQPGQHYLTSILDTFADNKVDLIRLDAAGYAIKRAGTNCFMLEETFAFIEQLSQRARDLNMQCLVEIHSHYQTQIEIAKRCDSVYDFALPPLVLHTLFSRDATALAAWLEISPRNCFTVLDTHDGIGIVDVGPSGDKPGLLNATEIDSLVETIHNNSNGQSRLATGAAASNVDLYQINCTFYNALGGDDEAYLLARAIQFFCPGIPQVYYAGLLAAENDMELLARTNVGRDINRPYLDIAAVKEHLQKPVVQGLLKLIELRNNTPAFSGDFSASYQQHRLVLTWLNEDSSAELVIELNSLQAVINVNSATQSQSFAINSLLE